MKLLCMSIERRDGIYSCGKMEYSASEKAALLAWEATFMYVGGFMGSTGITAAIAGWPATRLLAKTTPVIVSREGLKELLKPAVYFLYPSTLV